jgi:3D (Asp-Asp-Asp) domain-containing protein
MKRPRMWLIAVVAWVISPVVAWAATAVPTPAGALSPGDRTAVLPMATYTVQPGDTLWELSPKLGVPLEQLIADNDITDPHFLQPGQVLRYPAWLATAGTSATSRSGGSSMSAGDEQNGTLMYCTLTAYTAGYESTGKRPGDPDYGITSTGAQAREGVTIAVDPHVIPYGSRVYIPGLGWRVAQDTGGAIIGHRIDVFFNDLGTALRFGVQRDVPVYVVPPSGDGS